MKEFSVRYVLNVTPNCPNYFKEDSVEYLRISVTDTGSQKLITHFSEAFAYIGMILYVCIRIGTPGTNFHTPIRCNILYLHVYTYNDTTQVFH